MKRLKYRRQAAVLLAAALLATAVSLAVGASAAAPTSLRPQGDGPIRLTFARLVRRPPLARTDLWLRLSGRPADALERLADGLGREPWSFIDSAGKMGASSPSLVWEGDEVFLVLRSESLTSGATGLRELRGRLPLYPEARRVRFHLPWNKDDVPHTVEVDGGAATLERFDLTESNAKVRVGVRAPEGFRLRPGDGAVQAVVADIYGNLVNGGGVTAIQRLPTEGGGLPRFLMAVPDLRRTPSRLTVDARFVQGEPLPQNVVLKGLRFGR